MDITLDGLALGRLRDALVDAFPTPPLLAELARVRLNINLEAITAVVLGGTSLFGGRGAVFGTLVGALVVGVFRNGLTLIGVSSVYQLLVTGVLVILAVTADQVARRGARAT